MHIVLRQGGCDRGARARGGPHAGRGRADRARRDARVAGARRVRRRRRHLHLRRGARRGAALGVARPRRPPTWWRASSSTCPIATRARSRSSCRSCATRWRSTSPTIAATPSIASRCARVSLDSTMPLRRTLFTERRRRRRAARRAWACRCGSRWCGPGRRRVVEQVEQRAGEARASTMSEGVEARGTVTGRDGRDRDRRAPR